MGGILQRADGLGDLAVDGDQGDHNDRPEEGQEADAYIQI